MNDIKNKVSDVILTDNWKEIIEDDGIDIVIELIGGIEPAKSIITAALNRGKHIVTANKKLLAEEGEEILQMAAGGGGRIGFEAAVCGGIPCIQALRTGLVGNRIDSVMGILNGTTNYILTKMHDLGLPFDEILKDAQKKGFAEADPTFDVEGFDAGHKIAILSRLAFGKKIDYKKISIEGITKIREHDINYAKEMGYVIKLLGIGKLVDDEVDIRVHPAMLPMTHPLASVRNEFNAVMFSGDMTGHVTMFGKGAGSYPTASAVVSDIIQIAGKGSPAGKDLELSGSTKYISRERRKSMYYLRFNSEDRPGILSKVAGVLADHNISIATVIQRAKNTKFVPLVITTHEADEDGMLKSVDIINSFNFIDGKVTMIRVEDSNELTENRK
jgi:homoserine dehydrogenase